MDTAEALLPQITLETPLRLRKAINTLYQRAICYAKTDQPTAAQKLFGEVQQLSQQIGWTRLYYDAQNRLADLAMMRHEFALASQLLHEGLQTVERNRDQRRTAFYKRSLAQLALQQKEEQSAQRWFEEAAAIFEQLGMQQEVEKLHEIRGTQRVSCNENLAHV